MDINKVEFEATGSTTAMRLKSFLEDKGLTASTPTIQIKNPVVFQFTGTYPGGQTQLDNDIKSFHQQHGPSDLTFDCCINESTGEIIPTLTSRGFTVISHEEKIIHVRHPESQHTAIDKAIEAIASLIPKS